MKVWSQHIVPGVLLAMVAGCSVTGEGNALAVSTSKSAGPKLSAQQASNAATLRIQPYVDNRNMRDPRLLGQVNARVLGMHGNELMTDQEVAVLATTAIKQRFAATGFPVLDANAAGNALFEVSGIVKELTLNVKNRDDISIAIETTVKEVATGKVIWSALVVEKNDRFAGMSGNSKDDVIDYLNKGLRTVSNKTVEAVNAMLMAAHPELFNLTPGTRTIAGVTVNTAPVAITPTLTAYAPQATVTTGLLSVTTQPQHAKVYLDEVYFGLSPLRSAVEPGVHSVVVKLQGYKAATEKVSVRKGETTDLELNLER
jgi:hypothetical protein